MRKLNHSGFMLAEVIIVSTVVLGTLVGLYSIFTKMYVVYTERSYYNNVDTVYALRNIYKNLIDNNKMNELINDELKEKDTNKLHYIELINSTTCGVVNGNIYIEEEFCNKLKETYGITTVLFARYDENTFTDVNNNLIDYTNYNDIMKDYFKFLKDSTDFDNEEFSYMFLIELKDGEYYYYGNYRIR